MLFKGFYNEISDFCTKFPAILVLQLIDAVAINDLIGKIVAINSLLQLIAINFSSTIYIFTTPV